MSWFKRKRLATPSRPRLEEIEPRILYSADFTPALLDHSADQAVQSEHRVLDASGEFAHQRADTWQQADKRCDELVLVESNTPDYQHLITDIVAHADPNRRIEIIVLDAGKDGIAQITDILSHHQDLSAMHLISHGSDGQVQLGSTTLNFDTLLQNAGAIKGWGKAFSAAGDLLLYGCDVAQHQDGKALVNALARLTGTDVAASESLIGTAALGGSWTLRYQTGHIDVETVVDAQITVDWQGTLAYTQEAASWTPTTQNAWEVKDLKSAFGVPANAVVEIAISNSDSGAAQTGGVRTVGSSLNRTLLINKQQQGTESVEMLVQADANGQIQTFASSSAKIGYTVLGYWDSGVYVETMASFNVSANGSWQTQSLSAFGVTPGSAAEVVITNNTNNSPQVGVRTEGSALNRVVDIRNRAGGSGPETMTMLVKAGSTAAASIEAYAQSDNANVTFNVVGYWSSPPGNYTETFAALGAPSANAAWQSKSLSASGVPADALVDILFTNEQANTSNAAGVRATGSSDARTLALTDPCTK